MRPNIALIILTYNAAKFIAGQMQSIAAQKFKVGQILVIDSGSEDGTIAELSKYGVRCHEINKKEFDHGATRQLATTLVDADIYIYLTQDAVPANEYAFEKLVGAFMDEKVGCAYGRQLPQRDASLLAAHARSFSYPGVSTVRSYEDRFQYGIKTCFNSDSFAAYRKEALQVVGGFPQRAITSEDVYVAAKMLMQGWKVAYLADAGVYHSHNYAPLMEFQRYFDIGVMHSDNKWLLENFGLLHNEGMKYVRSELRYCLERSRCFTIFASILRSGLKYFGYKLGKCYRYLPKWMVKKLSMNKLYWDKS